MVGAWPGSQRGRGALHPVRAQPGLTGIRQLGPSGGNDSTWCTVPYRTVLIPGAVMPAGEGAQRRAKGEPRERAILSAVTGLLGEAGYEAMTMDAVAARARVSKTTIYRRWPGKAELVRAAGDAHIARRVRSAR